MVCIMRMLLSSPGNVSMIAAGSPAYSGSMYLSSVCRYLGKRKVHGVGKRRAKGAWRAKNVLLGGCTKGCTKGLLDAVLGLTHVLTHTNVLPNTHCSLDIVLGFVSGIGNHIVDRLP